MDLFSLHGERALVTGSAQGIGYALASGPARAGASIALSGRGEAKLKRAATALEQSGGTMEFAVFDATDRTAVRDGIEAIEARWPIDILVNNAGIQRRGALEDFPAETWHELMRANLGSVFFVSQAVARHMIPRGRGKIINVCSVQSELGRPSIAPYARSSAVKMLTKGMCADWTRHGLQINGFGPGYLDKERWGRVEELAGAASFLPPPHPTSLTARFSMSTVV